MRTTRKSVDRFLATLPDAARDDMTALDSAIRATLPGAARTLWEGVFWGGSEQRIIGYGDYTYARPRGGAVTWFRVGLALQKNYISVYINAVRDGRYVAETHAGRLGKVKVGKSSVSFRRLADVNLDELLALVAMAGTDADG